MPELQILICYNRPEDAVATYRQRWQIETCFRAMKSSGFNIEDTHLRDGIAQPEVLPDSQVVPDAPVVKILDPLLADKLAVSDEGIACTR